MIGYGDGCRASVVAGALHHNVTSAATDFDEPVALQDSADFLAGHDTEFT